MLKDELEDYYWFDGFTGKILIEIGEDFRYYNFTYKNKFKSIPRR
jgi:hypothetical protein